MPRTRPAVTNFSKGELSELLEGRVDLDQYYNGAKTLENIVALEQGAVRRRAGTRYVATVKTPTLATRCVRFVASKVNAYVLEFGDGYIRFYKNNAVLGGPTEIATPYVAADLRLLTFSQSNDVLYITSQFYMPRKLLRFSDTVWQLVTVPFTVQPSYEYGSRPVATLTPSATSGAGVTFTASIAQFQNSDVGREILIINGTNVGARAKIVGFTSTMVVTADISQNFVNTTANAAADWKITESYKTGVTPSAKVSVGTTITLTLDAAGWRTGDVGKFVQLNGGIVEITSITTTTVVNAIIRSELSTVTKAESDAWTLEETAWSTANGFPGCDEFFEERHYYAGSLAQPQTLWGSKSGDFDNFAVGVLDDDAVQFTIGDNQLNPIVWMRSARNLLIGTTNGEFSAFGGQDRVITPTNIEVRPNTSYGSTDDVQPIRVGSVVLFVTASTRRIRELVYEYSIDSYVAPDLMILAEHLTRDFGFGELGVQREPLVMLLAVRDDGVLCTATYLRDQNVIAWNRQITGKVTIDNVSGHATPISGFIESHCVIPHPNGDRDQVWLVVRRIINGVTTRYIEYIDDGRFYYRQLNTDAAKTYDGTGTVTLTLTDTTGPITAIAGSAFFVASDVGREIRLIGNKARAVITSFSSSTVVLATVVNQFPGVGPFAAGIWGVARSDLTALNHLNGELVDIVADGAVLPSKTVVANAVTADQKGIKMEVGLHYDSTLVTVRPEQQQAGGTSQALQKHISEVTVRLFETLGCQINDIETIPFRQLGDPTDQPPPLFTGDQTVRGLQGWDKDARITIRQKQPLPMTVLFITGLLGIGA